ncbi:hypothetical protein I79_007480 [Cricetulus griseus]|uniref:Uncharacterized protein n=1 Tax=Cricetulus griseus TaxID=10029 RepID=G3HAM5_CRIGR|nr:hypothetical protein I79_007480 [Cricetulus griseus]
MPLEARTPTTHPDLRCWKSWGAMKTRLHSNFYHRLLSVTCLGSTKMVPSEPGL